MISLNTIFIIYILILLTFVCKALIEKFYNDIINKAVKSSIIYAKNVTNLYNYKDLNLKDKELILSHAIAFLDYNYKNILKETNFYTDDKINSLVLSQIK